MKRYTAETITEHAEGVLVLFEDHQKAIDAELEASATASNRLLAVNAELEHLLDEANRKLDETRRELDETRRELDETRRERDKNAQSTKALGYAIGPAMAALNTILRAGYNTTEWAVWAQKTAAWGMFPDSRPMPPADAPEEDIRGQLAEANRKLEETLAAGEKLLAGFNQVTRERDVARATLVVADNRINLMIDEQKKRGGK